MKNLPFSARKKNTSSILHLLDWTNCYTLITSDTFFRINLGVFKALTIRKHGDCIPRTDRKAGRAAAAVFLLLKEDRDWFVLIHGSCPFSIRLRRNLAALLSWSKDVAFSFILSRICFPSLAAFCQKDIGTGYPPYFLSASLKR